MSGKGSKPRPLSVPRKQNDSHAIRSSSLPCSSNNLRFSPDAPFKIDPSF